MLTSARAARQGPPGKGRRTTSRRTGTGRPGRRAVTEAPAPSASAGPPAPPGLTSDDVATKERRRSEEGRRRLSAARSEPASTVTRRGRPPGTSRRALELIALRLFTEQGFEATTIEQIAAEAGVSPRTFFRYFSSKSSVLWAEFDHEV